MPRFSYKAKEGPVQWIDGVIEAADEKGAVDELVRRGYTPVDVVKEKSAGIFDQAKETAAARPVAGFWGRRVSPAAKAAFFRQLGDLAEAGVPILEALRLVQRQMRPPLQQIVVEVAGYVQDGESLSSAMTRFPGTFPAVDHQVVYAGELGGRLHESLHRLAEYGEREEEMRSQILTALMYPAFVLVVGVGAVIVLLGWVIPQMRLMLEEWNSGLPLATRLLMGLSDAVSRFGWMAAVLLVGGGVYLSRLRARPAGRVWLDRRKLAIPVWGRVERLTELTKFLRTLAMLLESGVVVVTALDAAGRVLTNEIFRQRLTAVRQAVADGESLSVAMQKDDFFPDNVVGMLAVGEQTGRPADAIWKAVRPYERELQQMLKGLFSLLGPVLILMVGCMVAFIVTALLLPIWQMDLAVR